ncbi:F-box/kelch-repeat protein, partial [Trifolium medium]|nr:F-box/kelch-repeat protein [Trifolium medium]
MEACSSSQVQNPLNPLNLPQIVTIGKTLIVTGNVMEFGEDLLKFCYDRPVDFESLKVNDFDVEELFLNQGWKRYFEVLNGPIFTNLIKEFWMKSRVYDDVSAKMEVDQLVLKDPSLKGKTREEMGLKAYNGTEIRSVIAGLDITITKAHFAKLLNLEDKGEKISDYKSGLHYRKDIKKEVYEDESLIGKSKGLKSNCLVLFKIFISSIVPRSGAIKDGNFKRFTSVAYPRLLSELFFQTKLVKVLRKFYPKLVKVEKALKLDAGFLSRMNIKKKIVKPQNPLEVTINDHLYCDGFLVISEADDEEVIQFFLEKVKETGVDVPRNRVPQAP